MSLLKTIEPEQAEGKVGEVYQGMNDAIGFIPNAIKMFSINPKMLEEQWHNLGYYIQHPTLSGKLFASIRMLVSVTHHCEYCIDFNAGMLLNQLGVTSEQLEAMKQNPENAPLDEKEKSLLVFVIKAVSDSNSVSEVDIQELRRQDCTDLEIFDALAHGARQVSGDILLNAFKVEKDF
jgi:AhpD family alkylhydroperoxidase